ncbi:peptidase inhibitor family I36 protein [Kutzneria sp. NPDC052558]|uniref:peptidase inhibitor family I36 protein n=1 Tax=Kutzneria sp. NPDC052558 TaxID=3364121 RepID=UPI0037C945EE
MALKRIAAVALAALATLVLLVGNASAAESTPAVQNVTAQQAMSPLAWECSAGDFCAWTGLNGTGSRCAWSVADPDWQSGSIRCSWSGTSRVQSYFNNGTSTSFRGVKLYAGANYTSLLYCAPQGTAWNVSGGGSFLRSHQWGNWTPNTCGP